MDKEKILYTYTICYTLVDAESMVLAAYNTRLALEY